MKLLKFTRPDGRPVWINADAIVSVAEAITSASAINTTIALSDGMQSVRETVDEVVQDLKAE